MYMISAKYVMEKNSLHKALVMGEITKDPQMDPLWNHKACKCLNRTVFPVRLLR